MLQAQLYFLSDQYYQDFPDDKLMKNKDTIDGVTAQSPLFLCLLRFQNSRNLLSRSYFVQI